MSEDRFDYGEAICEAVDTIISKRMENLAYDITKVCTIVDDSYKKQGKYIVKDNSIIFDAYTTITTLNENDSVLVLIPNGDYGEQKTILNKISYEGSSDVLSYVSPLDNMLKFTGNILNDQVPIVTLYDNNFSILANNPNQILKKIYTFRWDEYAGFTRMGISAKFQTRLNQYNVISGNYGIKFLFYSKATSGISGNQVVAEFDLGLDDMIGNPYYFEAFQSQSKLFDISDLENIKEVDICLYQNNDFIGDNGELIPYQVEGDPILNTPSAIMNDNILMSNFEIYLGYPLGEFDGDQVRISTSNYLSYTRFDKETGSEIRNLTLRWIHRVSENEYEIITEKEVSERSIYIYWFRYALNQTNSEYRSIAGPNWTTVDIAQSVQSNVFKSEFYPNYDKIQEKIKAVCCLPDKSGKINYYTSNILTFDNEQAIIDMKTYDAATQLSIYCLDETDGNYFIYNQSSDIINEGLGQGYERKFEARYKGLSIEDGELSGKIQSITWFLPVDNDENNLHTMLNYKESYYNDAKVTNTYNINKIERIADIDGNISYTQSYSIKNNWHSANAMNTIQCQILTTDGTIYETKLDLKFGKAGTSGTNITLVLDYENGNNAFTVYGSNLLTQEECIVKASIYDMAGAKISNSMGEWVWDWYYNKSQYLSITAIENVKDKIKLTMTQKFGMLTQIPEDNFAILSATFKPSVLEEEISTPVTAYLPIAIKYSDYGYLEGARKIIYNSSGLPEYYTDAYRLYDVDQNEVFNNLTWELKYVSDDIQYQPVLKPMNKGNREYKGLSANPLYIKSANNGVCINAKLNGNIIWSQPILIMQSQYDYATINNWNGQVNVGDKVIMSAMLGAGIKEEDNTFSGILIGDLQTLNTVQADEDVENTTGVGIYGLTKGVISFSMTEKGIATFGRGYDNGQTILGTDSDLISSGNGTMLLDIKNGSLNINYANDNEKLEIGKNNNYLYLTGKNNKPILNFSYDKENQDNYYIQSSNYIKDSQGLKLNLNRGIININQDNRSCIFSGEDLFPIKILSNNTNQNFYSVNWEGKISCSELSIPNGEFVIQNSGNIIYKGQDFEAYIKNLIRNTIYEMVPDTQPDNTIPNPDEEQE